MPKVYRIEMISEITVPDEQQADAPNAGAIVELFGGFLAGTLRQVSAAHGLKRAMPIVNASEVEKAALEPLDPMENVPVALRGAANEGGVDHG